MTDMLPHDEIVADSIAEDSIVASERDLQDQSRAVGRVRGMLRNILIALPLILLGIWTVAPFLVT